MKLRMMVLAACAAAGAFHAAADPMNDGTYSYIFSSYGAGEPTVMKILQNYYGGTWSGSATNYSNGALSATRLKDYGAVASVLGNSAIAGNDQSFSSDSTTFKLISKNAGDSSSIGWLDDAAGGAYHELFADTGAIGASVTANLSSNFRIQLHDKSKNTTFTTRASDNVKSGVAYDQMITYRINGLQTTDAVYVMCFEDLIGQNSSDYDFNDAVVEMRTNSVPAPASLALLSASGILARRRRR